MQWLIRNKLIPFSAALALALYTLLPFFAVYQVPTPAAGKSVASIFGEKILLCTADGFRFVSWEDLLNGKEKPKPHKQYKCPLCHLAANGKWITPPSPAAVAALPAVSWIAFYETPRTEAATLYWQPRLTRAPPASFIS